MKRFFQVGLWKTANAFSSFRYLNLVLGLVLGLDLLLAGAFFHHFEKTTRPDLSFFDSIWFVLTTVTTVGFGDLSPHTWQAKLSTVLFLYLGGLVIVAYFLSLAAQFIFKFGDWRKTGIMSVYSKDHIVICYFPFEALVRQTIEEFRRDERTRNLDIVIINNTTREFAIKGRGIHFVHGSPLDTEVHAKANTAQAKFALVYARNPAETESDALVASTVAVIRMLNKDARIIAECLDPDHRPLMEKSGANDIVYGGNLRANLMVQESQSPGVASLMVNLSTNTSGVQVYSFVVPERVHTTAERVANKLNSLGERIQLVAVNRPTGIHALPDGNTPVQPGDRVVYMGFRRVDESLLCDFNSEPA